MNTVQKVSGKTLVSLAAFARLVGVARSRVTQLVADGMPFDDAAGRIPRREALAWLADRPSANAIRIDQQATLAARAKAALDNDQEQAVKSERHAGFRSGIRHAISGVRNSFRSCLVEALPATLSRDQRVASLAVVDHLLEVWMPPGISLPMPAEPDFSFLETEAEGAQRDFTDLLGELRRWSESDPGPEAA